MDDARPGGVTDGSVRRSRSSPTRGPQPPDRSGVAPHPGRRRPSRRGHDRQRGGTSVSVTSTRLVANLHRAASRSKPRSRTYSKLSAIGLRAHAAPRRARSGGILRRSHLGRALRRRSARPARDSRACAPRAIATVLRAMARLSSWASCSLLAQLPLDASSAGTWSVRHAHGPAVRSGDGADGRRRRGLRLGASGPRRRRVAAVLGVAGEAHSRGHLRVLPSGCGRSVANTGDGVRDVRELSARFEEPAVLPRRCRPEARQLYVDRRALRARRVRGVSRTTGAARSRAPDALDRGPQALRDDREPAAGLYYANRGEFATPPSTANRSSCTRRTLARPGKWNVGDPGAHPAAHGALGHRRPHPDRRPPLVSSPRRCRRSVLYARLSPRCRWLLVRGDWTD